MGRKMNKIISLPKRTLIFFINKYQKHISPRTIRRCKYYPTCSEYAKQSLDKHGIIKGSFLSAWRILRCNPFSKGGIDKVK